MGSDIKFFAKKLLETFVNGKVNFRNLFVGNAERIKQMLGRVPTEEDVVASQRACYELRNKGYIYDPDGEGWYIATKVGKAALESGAYETSAGLRLIEYILDTRILQVSEQSFDAGKFPDSVFNASKMLEVAIREKAQLGPDVTGKNVVIEAFHPERGKLTLPICAVNSEKEGVMYSLMGIIAFLKNPESHRYTDWIDHETAIKALQSIEFQMKVIDLAVPRE